MGLFDSIKKAFGGAKDAAEEAAKAAAGQISGEPAAGQPAAAPAGAAPAMPQVQEEELSGGQEEWRDIQQLIARVEQQGISLAGLNPADPESYWKMVFEYERLQGEGMEPQAALQKLGFSDRDHYDLVSAYISGKWSVLTKDEDGDDVVQVRDEFTNAAMKARMGQMQGMQAAAAAADPNLLAPVNGVSIEQWAGAAAAMSRMPPDATPQMVAELLAKFKLDRATYDAAQAGWMEKMQGDTTGAIATKYGAAFTATTGLDQGAGGGEPCTFEQWVEVMAAQSAWAEAGLDVGATLKQTFNIDVPTYSGWSAYWSPKMATDIAMATRYSELEAKFRAKYAVAGADDDLSF